LVLVSTLVAGHAAAAEPQRCDLLFAGGRVVDGTGAPWFRADVCVVGDRIAAVGRLAEASARRRIDASSLVVAPGFIDMLGQSEYSLLVDPRGASKITQGITTEITGEGSSIAPANQRMLDEQKAVFERYGVAPGFATLADYFRALERARPALNLGTFVGAGGVRDLVIGKVDRPATPDELRAMEAAVDQAMREGALGLSTSLQYVPDRYASTDEIIALAKVAARHGGTYITHQRSESARIDESLDEVFRVAREAGIAAQVWHLKTAYRPNWGRMPAVLKRLEQARAQGLDVSANQYPYAAAMNGLDACLPLWVREGGRAALVERLKDPQVRARVKAEIASDDPSWENQYLGAGGAAGVMVGSVLAPALKRYEGRTLAQIAEDEAQDPLDVLLDLIVADGANGYGILFIMDEDDVRAALRHPLVAMCTDSGASATDGVFGQERGHPRGWGSAARILGRYVRDEKLLGLEEAVRKMTSLPASRLGLHDRGQVRPGMAADLVAFDPERVADRATFAEPRRYSAGIPYVAVNGELVVDGGAITSARPGRALRGPGHVPPSK
jgi:dihydroorotase/N-acyl-D-amino-acid deacylase